MRNLLTTFTWWRYCPDDASLFSVCYHWFNVFEACIWFAFGVLVLVRYLKNRKGWPEVAYALAFVTFGITDLIETQVLVSWLLWAKLCILVELLWLRAIVIKRYYPASRLY